MQRIFAALALTAALPLSAAPAAGQGLLPFTLEARTGLAVPVDDLAPSVDAGYFLEASAKLSPLPFVTLYAGWSVAEFGSDGDAGVAGLDASVTDSGLAIGGELAVPLAGLMTGVAPYLQVGAIFNRAEITVSGDASNTLPARSRRTRGFELGTGARIGIARRISIAPEVRYRGYRPEFESAPTLDLADEMSYIAASVGLTFHF